MFDARQYEYVACALAQIVQRGDKFLQHISPGQDAFGRPIFNQSWCRCRIFLNVLQAAMRSDPARSADAQPIFQQIGRRDKDIGLYRVTARMLRLADETKKDFLGKILCLGAILNAPHEISEQRRAESAVQFRPERIRFFVVPIVFAHASEDMRAVNKDEENNKLRNRSSVTSLLSLAVPTKAI